MIAGSNCNIWNCSLERLAKGESKEGVCIKLEAYTCDRRLPTCMDTESNCGFFEVALLYRSYQGTNDDLDNG